MPNSYEEWKGRDHELYIARLLAKFTETNRPIAAKYVAIRRLHGLAPSSLYIYANALHKLDASYPSKALDGHDAYDLLLFLSDAREHDGSPTLVGYIRLIRRFMQDVHGKLPPAMDAFLKAQEPRPPEKANIVSGADLDSLLRAATRLPESLTFNRQVRNQAILACLYDMGFRMSELLSLQFRDVSLEAEGVRFSLDPTHPELKSGARAIFGAECTPWLKAWMALHPSPSPAAYLFISGGRTNGRPLSRIGLRVVLHSLAAQAGLFQSARKKLSAHDFRHSSATRRAHWGEARLRLFHGGSKGSNMPSRYLHLHLDDLKGQVLRDAGIARSVDPAPLHGRPHPSKDTTSNLGGPRQPPIVPTNRTATIKPLRFTNSNAQLAF